MLRIARDVIESEYPPSGEGGGRGVLGGQGRKLMHGPTVRTTTLGKQSTRREDRETNNVQGMPVFLVRRSVSHAEDTPLPRNPLRCVVAGVEPAPSSLPPALCRKKRSFVSPSSSPAWLAFPVFPLQECRTSCAFLDYHYSLAGNAAATNHPWLGW